jgi:hypothetical protein
VELCSQLTERVAMGPYMIQSFTFVPDRTGFVAILHNADGSFTHCAWHNIPPTLATLLSREASKGISRVAVGVNGSFVVVLKTGCMWWSGVPESLGQLLDDAKRAGRRVAVSVMGLWNTLTTGNLLIKYSDRVPFPYFTWLVFCRIRGWGHYICPPSRLARSYQ